MTRSVPVTTVATLLCIAVSACEAVLGDVDVDVRAAPAPPAMQGSTPTGAAGVPSMGPGEPSPSSRPPLDVAVEVPGPAQVVPGDAGALPAADAGAGDPGPDAALPPPDEPQPRPVVVNAAVELPLIGDGEGGSPRLGTCQGGFLIGIRPTANPVEDVFGQRLVFLEPICASARVIVSDPAEPAAVSVTLEREDGLLTWSEVEPFVGVPVLTVPDDRLQWIPQPEVLCPEAAPALVGFSGEYDPVAPDSTDTSAIRSLVIECAPLVVAPNGVDVNATDAGRQLISRVDGFAVGGTDTYQSSCEGGSAMTQLVLHSGFWLDGFVVGCSSLRSPRFAGEPCAAEAECQSSVCTDAVCASE